MRQQAGPLPTKRGELGFTEGVHVQIENGQGDQSVLPARHPADRLGVPPSADQPSSPPPVHHDAAAPASNTIALEAANDPNKPILLRLKPKLVPGLGGVRLMTFLAFIAQVLLMAIFIMCWVLTANKLAAMNSNPKVSMPGGTSSVVFIHVVFVFAIIGQLIFAERRVYRIRAERFAFKHPGEMLPRYRDRGQQGGDLTFAWAPWNRPPLPTYAAALAQSGHGSADADDHLIAVPPPPAYGNTRGSRMLLQGVLSEDQRAQRPASVHTLANPDLERGEGVGGETTGTLGAQRDQQRQAALARLERNSSSQAVA